VVCGSRFMGGCRPASTRTLDRSSRAWQLDSARQTIAGRGRVMAEFFDVGWSRRVPWAERPEAAALLAAATSLEHLFDQVASENWTACHDNAIDACLRDTLLGPASEATNMSRRPTICGPVILAIEHPETWSVDRQAGQTARSMTKTARVQVRCVARSAS
jgi:hypothetical protein